MKLLIGLGNPGKKYELSRHNVGWLVLDWLVKDLGLRLSDFKMEKKFEAEVLDSEHWDVNSPYSDRLLFVRPQTFMNESGRSVKSLVDFYKLDFRNDILVIHDDKDLQFGTVRFTTSSSSAGQNGVQDIIEKLVSQDFHRVRVGVETRASRTQMDTRDFVLSNFTDEEIKKLKEEIFPKIKAEANKFLITTKY